MWYFFTLGVVFCWGREFITLRGGAAALAQGIDRSRRIGVLMDFAAN